MNPTCRNKHGKHAFLSQLTLALLMAFLLMACQKEIAVKDLTKNVTVSNEANSPLQSHSISFTSDYPVKPGEVPPFSFTKTLYPDARVRTIRMLSRKNPIHPAFRKEAVELIGTFTYSANTGPDKAYYPHLANLKGTSEVWEYYRTPSGQGARRSILKKPVDLYFQLTRAGYCGTIVDGNYPALILFIGYAPDNHTIYEIDLKSYDQDSLGITRTIWPIIDEYNNILRFEFPYNTVDSYYRIEYDYSVLTGVKNYNYIPSQNLISQEYSLLEVMQWLPQSYHQRKSAGGSFKVNGQWVTQDQVYKNFQFDSNGNLRSLTYGDNVLQKTTWHVQP